MAAGFDIPHRSIATSPVAVRSAIAFVLVAATVLFNFVLSVVNNQLRPLSPVEVQAAEAMMLAIALIMAMACFRAAMRPWIVLIWFLTIIAVIRWSWLGYVDPKTLRDVIIIPVFVSLGIAAGTKSLTTLVVMLQAVVLAIMVWEGLAPEAYSEFLGIKSYYINTRGFEEETFWDSESNLFISANRPNDRFFFSSLNIHRLSSVFLEPVSLGNYCIIISTYICAMFRTLSRPVLIFLILSNVLLLIGSDGRLAAFCSILIFATAFLIRGPKYLSLLFLPAATLISFVLYLGLGVQPWTDDLPGRVALTAELLSAYTAMDMLGLGHAMIEGVADSGIAYLIATQSIFGVALLWAFIVFGSAEDRREQALYKQGLVLYLALTMMVSYSFLTIKTAGLAWFILGALQSVNGSRNEPRFRRVG